MIKNINFLDFYAELIKLFSFINNFKKIYIFILLLILILSAIFEILILGVLFILIKAFMNPDYYSGNFFFKFLIKLFNLNNNSELILLFSFSFIIICFLSGFFRLSYSYFASKFSNYTIKKITNLCYDRIIYQDFNFYFSSNTSSILSIFSQKLGIINNAFFNTINMFYNIIIFFFIFFILSYINFWIIFFSTIFFIILYTLIIFFFKQKIIRNGSTTASEQIVNLRIVRETLNGFKDILINNNQNFYRNNFINSSNKLLGAKNENIFIFSVSRPIIETFLLSSIAFVIIINSNNYASLEKLLPILATIGVAAQRMLPILNQIYTSHANNLDQIKTIKDVNSFIIKSPIFFENKTIKSLTFKESIVMNDVTFFYSSKNSTVLNHINLNIKHGTRIGIIGKSGSGKSTLADLILGIINPNSGEILVDGTTILNKKQSWYKKVANVSQNIFITEQSIAENIAFGIEKKAINLNKVKHVARLAQISDFIENKLEGYNSLIGEKGLKISVGQRQRIAIARALYKNASLIIFDEATSSLDSEVENLILDTIFNLDRKKYTVIIISHKYGNLDRCDNIYKIQNSILTKV
jgi:ABC-type multidrug transport system fused ATPase/permease subunit